MRGAVSGGSFSAKICCTGWHSCGVRGSNHPQLRRRRARGCGRERHAPGLPADGLGVVHAVEALGEEGIGGDRRGDALDLGLGARRADGRRPGTSLCGGLLPATRERGARGGAELEGGAEGGGHLSYFGESAERCADARVPGAVSGRQRRTRNQPIDSSLSPTPGAH